MLRSASAFIILTRKKNDKIKPRRTFDIEYEINMFHNIEFMELQNLIASSLN